MGTGEKKPRGKCRLLPPLRRSRSRPPAVTLHEQRCEFNRQGRTLPDSIADGHRQAAIPHRGLSDVRVHYPQLRAVDIGGRLATMANQAIWAVATLCLLLPLLKKLLKWHRNSQFAQNNGCKPARVDNLLTWMDPLGIGILRKLERHLSQHTLLEFMRRRFEENGNTFQSRVLLDDFYWTCEVTAGDRLCEDILLTMLRSPRTSRPCLL